MGLGGGLFPFIRRKQCPPLAPYAAVVVRSIIYHLPHSHVLSQSLHPSLSQPTIQSTLLSYFPLTYLHPGFRSCQDVFVCPPVRHLFEVVRRGRVGRERAPRIVWSLKAARRSRTQPHAKDWAEDYITTVTTSWYTRPLHFQSTYFRCGRFSPAGRCTVYSSHPLRLLWLNPSLLQLPICCLCSSLSLLLYCYLIVHKSVWCDKYYEHGLI